jgi:hypothetical protein
MVTGRSSTGDRHALDINTPTAAVMKKMIPGEIEPHFISCPLQVDGPDMRVFINAEGISEESYLTVELLDEQCKPLPGYSGEDCIRVTKSGLRQPVAWRNKQSLEKFSRPFRIKVRWGGPKSEDTFVYAVYVSKQEQAG